jgi:hypothetical protein
MRIFTPKIEHYFEKHGLFTSAKRIEQLFSGPILPQYLFTEKKKKGCLSINLVVCHSPCRIYHFLVQHAHIEDKSY